MAVLDGRVARGALNRQAVVEAFLDLVQEGDLRPTAQRVAQRAGVSLRSVFHHFEDMEGLLASAADVHVAQHPLRPLPSTGPLAGRIDAFVDQRVEIAEQVLPVYRAALLAEPFSPVVAGRLASATDAMRGQLRRAFAGELRHVGDDRLEALDLLTGFDGWARLRLRQRLSVARAKRVMREALAALLSE
jgi:TetR/AcrR family transcriptional regulator, regulator of autoinduction and epiphytic fitness